MKRILAITLAGAIARSLAACGSSTGSNVAAPSGVSAASSGTANANAIVIKLGHGQTEAHPYHLGAQKFADLVDQYTSGSVKVQIYPNGTLGAERDMVEGVSMGTIDACITTNAPLTNFDSGFGVFEFPYMFQTEKEAHQILDSDIGQKLMAGLESQNIKGLAYFENGFRNVTNDRREIKTVKDLAGLKIRTMDSEINIAAFKAMGANPTPMDWGDVYTALQQGTIDGEENPPMAIVDGKLYEVNKYMSMTRHFYAPAELLMRKDLFDGLTADQQAAVQKAAAEACTYQREQAADFNSSKIDDLKKNGMIITDVDTSSFAEACKSVYEKYDKTYGDEIRAIQTTLGR